MKFSLFALLALGVIACSSPQNKSVQLAESHPDRVARTISSVVSEEALAQTYTRLLQSNTPNEDMSDYFDSVALIYFRAETFLKDYDKVLEELYQDKNDAKISDLQTDDSYARLISAWILRERVTQQLTYIYRRNIDGLYEAGSSADRERLLVLDRAFKGSLEKHAQGENKLALQALYEDLLQEFRDYRSKKTFISMSISNKEEKSIAKNIFADAREQENFVKANKSAITSRINLAATNHSLNEQITDLEQEVKAYLQDQFLAREPQANGDVVASASSKGNLTGNTFRTGRWALTYDDGPSGKHTTTILNDLEARGMKASFFWLSSLTPSYATLINRAKGLGMALGNHSHSHANLPKLGPQGLKREIVESTATHARMYGAKPTFFRCPYGACGGNGSTIRQMIANEGMVHIFWNIDSLDWQDKNAASVVNRVTKAMAVAKKGIILFHDIHPQSAEATRMLMDAWVPEVKAGRMRLLTIPQAISELNSTAGMQ